jgi:hypothetical protein
MDPIGREDGKGVRGRGALGVWDRRRGDGVAGSGFLEEAGEGPQRSGGLWGIIASWWRRTEEHG